MNTNRLLSADEVAAMLGVTPGWVYQRARQGDLPTVRLGRYRKFRPEAVEDWVRRQESGA